MRVVYTAAEALLHGTAAATHVHEIARALRSLGHNVDIVSCPIERESPASTIVGSPCVWWRALRTRGVLLVRFHPVLIPMILMARLLRRDVVIELNGPPTDLVNAHPMLRVFGAAYTSLVGWALRSSSAVIAISDVLSGWCRDVGVQAVTTVSNGANADVFRPDLPRPEGAPPKYVLFFGSFAPWQGLSTLLRARAASGWPDDVSLVIIGRGGARPQVAEAAASDTEIYHLEPMPQEVLASYVAHALATISVKDHAGGLSPLKVYESLACGTPVICSDQSELLQILAPDDRLGRAIEPGDHEALASAVDEMARRPDATAAIREHAIRYHSWKSSARTVADVLQSVSED